MREELSGMMSQIIRHHTPTPNARNGPRAFSKKRLCRSGTHAPQATARRRGIDAGATSPFRTPFRQAVRQGCRGCCTARHPTNGRTRMSGTSSRWGRYAEHLCNRDSSILLAVLTQSNLHLENALAPLSFFDTLARGADRLERRNFNSANGCQHAAPNKAVKPVVVRPVRR